jgi:hypothetical protein
MFAVPCYGVSMQKREDTMGATFMIGVLIGWGLIFLLAVVGFIYSVVRMVKQ